ncbi:MAG: DNA polymerase III subunit delta [Phycisphaeraceae bacterium]|nr:DNA polymerase III subunit delta [Phycisphaeraceae bacterium]
MARAAGKAERAALSAQTRVAILHGPERFLQELYTDQLREALIKVHGAGDAVQVVRFDGGALGAASGGTGGVADILDECRSYGLMASYKLVVVDNADDLVKSTDDEEGAEAPKAVKGGRGARVKTAREILESYTEEPSDSATLVLRADTWRPGRLDKAVAALGARGAVMKCEPPSEADAARWARARCSARHGGTLTEAGAAQLVQLVGPELGRIDSELGKLALANPGEPIGPELVKEFVGMSREEKFFAIQASLLSGDAREALTHLRELVDVSRQDPVPLGWAFTDLARKVHGLSRGMAQGESPQSLMRTLKIWGRPDEVDRLVRASKRLSPDRAAGLLQAAINTDVALKSSLGDPVRNLETLALRFTSALG